MPSALTLVGFRSSPSCNIGRLVPIVRGPDGYLFEAGLPDVGKFRGDDLDPGDMTPLKETVLTPELSSLLGMQVKEYGAWSCPAYVLYLSPDMVQTLRKWEALATVERACRPTGTIEVVAEPADGYAYYLMDARSLRTDALPALFRETRKLLKLYFTERLLSRSLNRDARDDSDILAEMLTVSCDSGCAEEALSYAGLVELLGPRGHTFRFWLMGQLQTWRELGLPDDLEYWKERAYGVLDKIESFLVGQTHEHTTRVRLERIVREADKPEWWHLRSKETVSDPFPRKLVLTAVGDPPRKAADEDEPPTGTHGIHKEESNGFRET